MSIMAFVTIFKISLFVSIIAIANNYVIDQDNFRNSTELIESRGFRSESHRVVTRDGYILTVFRVVNPYGDPTHRRPVILWHGITMYSDVWLISTEGRLGSDGVYTENIRNDCQSSVTSNLAYTLSACGYDVWLPNTRGNKYSTEHLVYNNSDPEFWKHTFTELGMYDCRAVVEHVLNVTGQASVAYIGHSMGSTSMFVLLSLEPSFERFVRPFIALAPFVYMSHMGSALKTVTRFEPLLRATAQPIGMPVSLAQFFGVFLCANQYLTQLCTQSMYALNGYDPFNLNMTRAAVYTSHSFATYSTWLYAQIAQLIQSGTFSAFDSGPATNLLVYGQTRAPEYPLRRITSTNIAIFYGLNDNVSNVTDVRKLISNLQVPLLDDYLVPFEYWAHQDFHWGINQGYYVNARILSLLRL